MFNLDSNTIVFYIEKVHKWWNHEISANSRGSSAFQCRSSFTCFVSPPL